MVPLASPEHEKDLIPLASPIAKQREATTVDAIHIRSVPDQPSLGYASEHPEEIEEDAHAVLDAAQRDAETFGVDIQTRTIFSHQSVKEVFNAARTQC